MSDLGMTLAAGVATGLVAHAGNRALTMSMRRADPNSSAPILPTMTLAAWGVSSALIGGIGMSSGAGRWAPTLAAAGVGMVIGGFAGLNSGLRDATEGAARANP